MRSRYVEMFNVMLYVAHALNDALAATSRKHDKLRSGWHQLEGDLAMARRAAAAEGVARGELERELEMVREQAEELREHSEMAVAAMTEQREVRTHAFQLALAVTQRHCHRAQRAFTCCSHH